MAEWAGSLYHGIGVERDVTASLTWYEKSVAAGERRAMYDLGAIYHGGKVVSRDDAKAMQLFLRAAKAGHPRATLSLAEMYCYGWGVPQDLRQARLWLSQASPWRFPETPALEKVIHRKMRTRTQRVMRYLAPGFGALAALLGVIRLRDIRRRLNEERRQRAENGVAQAL